VTYRPALASPLHKPALGTLPGFRLSAPLVGRELVAGAPQGSPAVDDRLTIF